MFHARFYNIKLITGSLASWGLEQELKIDGKIQRWDIKHLTKTNVSSSNDSVVYPDTLSLYTG